MPFHPLFVLTLITAASAAMFTWNVRRSTHRRPQLDLERFAHTHHLTLNAPTPQVLRTLLPNVAPHTTLGNPHLTLFSGRAARGEPVEPAGPPVPLHLLILRINADWPPTSLRPTRLSSPLTHALHPYPSLPGTDRFTTHSTSLRPAKTLAHSPLRTLLPPDLTLLLHGPHLLLDFSSRPFDPLEFSRLLPLATQLAQHLPTL